jgi:hypothetical protein
MNLYVAAALAAFCLFTTSAAAAGRLEFSVVDAGTLVPGDGYTVNIDQGRVAVSESGDGQRVRVIFVEQSGQVIFIDHAHREYTVMTEAWLREANEKAHKAFDETQKRMKAQSENLSPTARKQVEQANSMMRLMPLMGGLFGDSSRKNVSYSRTGRRSDYQGLSCAQHEEITDGERSRIVCFADVETIGLDAEDASVVENFIGTLVRLYDGGVTEFGFDMPFFMVYDTSLQGFPIAASDPDQNGYVLMHTADQNVDAELLEVPESYLEAEIPLFGF